MNSFEQLDVWQEARRFVLKVYDIQSKFPAFEKYGLADQLRRAVISVSSNIAEGSGRRSWKDKIRFIEYAYGSLMEVYCQLILADDLHYLDEGCMDDVRLSVEHIGKMLSGLQASFERMSGKQQNPNP